MARVLVNLLFRILLLPEKAQTLLIRAIPVLAVLDKLVKFWFLIDLIASMPSDAY